VSFLSDRDTRLGIVMLYISLFASVMLLATANLLVRTKPAASILAVPPCVLALLVGMCVVPSMVVWIQAGLTAVALVLIAVSATACIGIPP